MGRLYLVIVRMLFVSACFLICGCETIVDSISSVIGQNEAPVDPQFRATRWDGPRICPGIALIVQVGPVADPPTVMNVLVDQKGEITLPLLLDEPVKCDGMKLEDLKQKLIKEYSKYYRQPMVTVTFAPYDGRGVSPWGTVTVLGEVNRQGPVNMPATMDMTVTKVLQEAGGCRPYANKSAILVTRCDADGNQTKTRVDIDEIGKDGRVDKDILLRPGDVVWVPTTWY